MGLPAANLRPVSPLTRPPEQTPSARDGSPEPFASANGKILPVHRLAEVVAAARDRGRKVVHCHGVFDLLHIGHIRYFEQARRMGDLLVVTVTPDRYVDKGSHRPAFPELLRAEAVASLGCVDFAAINEWPTAEETLRLLRPHVYVKGSEFRNIGSDMTGKIAAEAEVVSEIGAELRFTEDIVFSSSNLINRYLSNLPEELNEYLDLFRKRWSLDQVLETIDRMESLRVLVVGDTILDEYQYCDAMGKSSKDPVLALRYRSHDLFAGGVLAVANHVSNFAGRVDLVTAIGEVDSHEGFIRSKLNANVEPRLFVQPGAPTTVKRRFLDGYSFNKLFEVYVMDDSGLPRAADSRACQELEDRAGKYDLVIAADFGHGAVSPEMVRVLAREAPYLAVNAQANAGNRGFHTVTRYPRADYACLAEHEIRLETRDLRSSIRPMMDRVAKKLSCPLFVVTRGRSGCLIRGGERKFVAVPAFAHKTIDRVGAGDAFFSVTALAAAQRVPCEVLGFIGNVAGALAVEILGNQKAIDKLSVKKSVTSLMK